MLLMFEFGDTVGEEDARFGSNSRVKKGGSHHLVLLGEFVVDEVRFEVGVRARKFKFVLVIVLVFAFW